MQPSRGIVGLIALAFLACFPARLSAAAALPAQVELPVMRTSIYVGSVKLITSAFTQVSESYSATYEAKVSPWSWWSEAGTVTLAVKPEDYERLLRGETVELTGEATNDKGKPRQVTARAQPIDQSTGRIKVRIRASGTTLIFNGTYALKMELPAAG